MSVSEFRVEDRYRANLNGPLRFILSHVFRHPLPIAGVFIGAFANAALAAVAPTLIGIAFDAIVTGASPDYDRLFWASTWIVISQLVRAVFQLGRNFSSEVIGQRLERDIRDQLYSQLLGKDMTFHDSQPVGDTMARATNDVREINLMFNPGINLVIGSGNFLLMPLLFAPSIHPQLIAAPLFFAVSYAIALTQYLYELNPITEKVRSSFGHMNARLAEAIDGIETVKGAAQEQPEITEFNQRAGTFRDAFVHQGRVEARFLPLLLLGFTLAGGFWHATSLYFAEQISLGSLVEYTGLLSLFGFPVFVSLFAYSQVSLGLAGARRILELIKAETDLDENAGGHTAPIDGAVRFEDVTFGYKDGNDVLKHISFDVEPGQTIAITGQTGAGKTTLVKLINRIYDVRSGSVTIDGIDVRDWDLASLRHQVSIIEQDIFLLSRSIRDNIAFGVPNATQAQVEEAAKLASAHDFIMSFKDGYNTEIGERGVTLSGGQRQRLALARAFLTRPHILILDDSTSAIDSATEDQIQRAIQTIAQRQTTFLITHRLSQIRWADKIIVMRKGEVVAVGTHDELLETTEAYRRIFERYEGDN